MRRARDVGHQQAASQQADLAVQPQEVSDGPPTPCSCAATAQMSTPLTVLVIAPIFHAALSSRYSGPKRFDYDADSKTWFCHKEGETSTLHELLQGELSEVFATDVEILLEDE